MMFNRLIGFIENHNINAINLRDPNSDVRLATAVLLFSVVPADYQNLPIEGEVLVRELGALLQIGPKRCHKLIARAAAERDGEPSIFASATLLKRKTSIEFRQNILKAIDAIAKADGEFHAQELDLAHRAARLLGETGKLSA
jgi:uncharacterized tellurite resistance protein B-like protein